MIDTNVYLSRWPTRRLALDEPAALVEKLQVLGVTSAWAGTLDGLLHKDVTAANQRLAEDCRDQGAGVLLPFGSVNPALPGWSDDLRRCHEQHGMRGIRLHPGYHGYGLDDPRFAELLDLAAERNLIVQIAIRMEDERTQHPLLRVSHVDTAPLPDLLQVRPGLRCILLNALRDVQGPVLEAVAACENAFVEIAMLEGVAGLEPFLTRFPLPRVLLGTYAPVFYPESAILKLDESELGDARRNAIATANAERLLSP